MKIRHILCDEVPIKNHPIYGRRSRVLASSVSYMEPYGSLVFFFFLTASEKSGEFLHSSTPQTCSASVPQAHMCLVKSLACPSLQAFLLLLHRCYIVISAIRVRLPEWQRNCFHCSEFPHIVQMLILQSAQSHRLS